jgi:hypothetical protein
MPTVFMDGLDLIEMHSVTEEEIEQCLPDTVDPREQNGK